MFWTISLLTSGTLLFFYIFFMKKRPKGYPPGPRGIPLLGYKPWLGEDSYVSYGKLGKKYGNIYSIQIGSLSMVVLNDVETVKAALKMEAFSGRPNYLPVMSLYKLGIVFSTGKVWKEQRKFSLKALRDMGFGKRSMETLMQEEVSDLVDYFRTQANQPIEFRDVLAVSVLNSLWMILTGKKFSLHDPKPRKLLRLVQEGIMDPEFSGLLYILPWLAKNFPGKAGLSKSEDCVTQLKTEMKIIIKEHQQNFPVESPRDFTDLYLQKMAETTDPNSSFYQQAGIDNLVDTLLSLFAGGQDTMASTMEFTLLYLLTYPEKRKKMQVEIDRVVGQLRTPSISDRPKLPYVDAVMHESMRLSSIAPGSILHSTTEDLEFQGFKLAKGTIIMPNLYQVHHDEAYWKDPETFRPERFINEDGSFRKDENVIPFSFGKRVCPAENMAMVECFLYLSNLFHAFDVESDPNCPLPGLKPRKPALVLSPNPYKVVFKERAKTVTRT